MSNISLGGQSIHVGQKPKGIQFVVSNVFSLSVLLLGYIHFLEKKILQTDFKSQMTIE